MKMADMTFPNQASLTFIEIFNLQAFAIKDKEMKGYSHRREGLPFIQ